MIVGRPGAADSTTDNVPPSSASVSWMWFAVLACGIALFEGVRTAFAITGNVHYAPALILIGAATVPFAFTSYVIAHGRRPALPATVLMATALVGGTIGVIAAGLVEYDALQRLGTLPVLVIALAEETAKLLVPAALLLVPPWRREVANGLALGVAAGAGFAVLETMGFAIATLVRNHDDLTAIDATLMHRGLLSPAAHMAWTGLTVAALWFAAARRWRPRATATFLTTFALAVALHTIWDGVGTLAAYAVLGVVGLGLLLGATRLLPTTPRAVTARPNAQHGVGAGPSNANRSAPQEDWECQQ